MFGNSIAHTSTDVCEYVLTKEEVARKSVHLDGTHADLILKLESIGHNCLEDFTLLTCTLYEVFIASRRSLYRIFDERDYFENKSQSVKRIAFPIEQDIKQIVAGGAHLLILNTTGRVWSMGSGTHGELGMGSEMSSELPRMIEYLSRVVKVDCGTFHSVALTDSGELFVWGWNERKQLSDTANGMEWEPRKVEIDGKVVDVRAFGNSTRVTVEFEAKKKIFVFGDDDELLAN